MKFLDNISIALLSKLFIELFVFKFSELANKFVTKSITSAMGE